MKIFGLELRSPFATQMTKPVYADVVGQNTNAWNLEVDATSIACRDLIANAVAGLSVDLYDKNDKRKVPDHYLNRLLRNPNSDEPRSLFFYNLVQDYFHGNVYLYKFVDNTTGQIISLFRIDPLTVTVERDMNNQKVFSFGGKTYDYRNILHIPSRWGYDGIKGMSIFDYARQVFNVTRAVDSYSNNAFDNSLGKRLIIDIAEAFPNATAEQVEAIRAKYVSAYTGSANAGRPIVKTNKIKFESIDSGLPDNRATQLIENRNFQEGEIAKLFGVPTSLLRGENKYGDVESLYQILIDTAICPITNVFQQYFDKLLSPVERDSFEFGFNFNSLLKTSLASRIDAYSKQLNNPMLTVNEVRTMEGREPVDGGDTLWRAANLIPVRQDVEDAMLASAKLKAQELISGASPSTGIGSDKL